MRESPSNSWRAGSPLSLERNNRLVSPASSLAVYLRRLREVHALGGMDAVERMMREGRLAPALVEPYALLQPGRYTRTLLYRDEDLEIMVLGWGRGSRSPIHGHDGQDCCLMTVAGELEVDDYRLVSGGAVPGHARVERRGPSRTLLPGALDSRDADQDLHAVRPGARSGYAISLHVYSRPIDECLVYDPDHSRCERRQLRYDRVMSLADPSASRVPPPPAAARAPGRLTRLWQGLFRGMRQVKETVTETVKETLVPALVGDDAAKLSVKGMGHRYANKVVALQDVNLNIRSGEFVCLLGPSGCGKSTLLYALAGHLQPTGGHVRIDGKDILGPGPDRLLMFQEAALFPWLTVRQNLEFVLAARGVPRRERAERAHRFIQYVHLGGFENALPHELSGGMRMCTALARALAVDSQVLLMDEPFGSLDAQTRQHMHLLLQRVWMETRKTIVFVTHDVTEALMLANRVVVMAPRPGRILQDLEVHLPMPRGPDDLELVGLARRIREMLDASESMGGPEAPGEGAGQREGMASGAEAAGSRRVAGRLGPAGPVRALAPSPLPGTEGGR
ncbi:MAG: ATP-binding cassette domain-containing protein [Cystobacter sp.]